MKTSSGALNYLKSVVFMVVCGFFILHTLIAHGRIINVPQDYSDISGAVWNSHDGDEIIVAPGIYRGFSYFGRNIIIRSTFIGDWSVVRNTIINGGVEFSDDQHLQKEKCILRGFSIKGNSAGINGLLYDGVGTHATIEYNIISGNGAKAVESGGIIYCDGLIQNNIIEDNIALFGAAISSCQGTIQNNIIRHNRAYGSFMIGEGYIPGAGGAIANCNGIVRNNTIVDNFQAIAWNGNSNSPQWGAGGLDFCNGTIVNNIIYHTTMTLPVEFVRCSTPSYCLFRALQAGVGNITGDPKFVDPTNGDYHLRPDSPCIDAGKAQSGLKADPDGHQRGLKAGTAGKGDGSGTDIGAYEALPKPVAIWLPDGGPPQINDGDQLAVSWVLEPPADTAVRLRLYAGGRYLADLGRYQLLSAAAFPIQLPKPIYTRADYTIVALSIANAQGASYLAETPPFTIIGTRKNAIPAHLWQGME